jgi:hypothetical protein
MLNTRIPSIDLNGQFLGQLNLKLIGNQETKSLFLLIIVEIAKILANW